MRLQNRPTLLALAIGTALAVSACFSDTLTDPGNSNTGPGTATLTGNISASRVLSADTVYTLSGYVKVQSGATLTIPAGTKVIGDTTVAGSSLWILRGARINAQGTAANPIVFTSARAVGSRKPGDWGGIVIIGNARINRTANPVFTEGPSTVAENYAGGTDDDDNSGTMRYVRIEFAGYDVSNGQGQELNSLSLYAVGRGTTLEYLESLAGLDDSFEWFGGTVDGRYLVSYESGDDHFDWTEGYSGRNQFMIALQSTTIAPRPGTGTLSTDPRGFEGDGCENTKPGCTFANTPLSRPVFANFTIIGPGTGVFAPTDGNGAVIRRGSGGTFVNGIIGRWPLFGISLRDAETNALRAADSVMVRNVILSDNASNFEPAGTNFGQSFNVVTNNIMQPAGAAALFASLSTAGLDWTPSASSAARTGGLASFTGTPIAGRVTAFFGGPLPGTAYVGAQDPAGTKWWQGWTSYALN
ncbi:MAG: hypothetical protein ABI681_12110 [Gemmatimonadales bacterium]